MPCVRHAEAETAPSHVVYITATKMHRAFASTLFAADASGTMSQNSTHNFTVKCAWLFSLDIESGFRNILNNIVLLIDVRMAATVDEEVMFGAIIDHMHKAVSEWQGGKQFHIAVFLLGFFSKRTLNLFKKVVKVVELSTEDTYPAISIRNREWIMKQMDQILQDSLENGQRIIISSDNPSFQSQQFKVLEKYRNNNGEPLSLPYVPSDNPEADIDTILKSPCFTMDPSSQFSIRSNLGIIMSYKAVNDALFDADTFQIVKTARQLTKRELDYVLACAKLGSSQTRFFASYTREELEDTDLGTEAVGSAWNEQLMTLVLQTIYMFGRDGQRPVGDYPIREPINHAAWLDRLRRLVMLGCVEENAEVKTSYRLTTQGKMMRELVVLHGLP